MISVNPRDNHFLIKKNKRKEEMIMGIINKILNNQDVILQGVQVAQKLGGVYHRDNPSQIRQNPDGSTTVIPGEAGIRTGNNIFSGCRTWAEAEQLEWRFKFESLREFLEMCTSPDGSYNEHRRKVTCDFASKLGLTLVIGGYQETLNSNYAAWNSGTFNAALMEAPYTFGASIKGSLGDCLMTYTFHVVADESGQPVVRYYMKKIRDRGITADGQVSYVPSIHDKESILF